MVTILLTEDAHRRLHGAPVGTAPDVSAIRLQPDGSLLVADRPISAESATPEIAWATADLLRDGLVQRFFSLAVGAQSLRWLASSGAGVDHPAFAELVARDVVVTNAHVSNVPISEYVLRAVLDLFQRAGEWRRAQADREWQPHVVREVFGSRWLIVGFGAIGSAVAERARAFGAHVVGVRRAPRGDEPAERMVTPDQLRAVLPVADVVVLAAPLTESTRLLADASFLAAMRSGAVLVNVGRGALVDEDALLDALDRSAIAAAVLDVTSVEPLPSTSPLWSHPGVVLTPHSSAISEGNEERAAELFQVNFDRWRRGEPLLNRIELTGSSH